MNTIQSIPETRQPDNQPITLWELLFEGKGANPARPILMGTLGLDAASADFLAGAVYWRLKMQQPFYKFNTPNEHDAYREGDSWIEELGISEYMLGRARSVVATKNTTGNDLAETLRSSATDSLVIYWTDERRMTWYDVRLDLLAAKLSTALDVEITAGTELTIQEAASVRRPVERRAQPATIETRQHPTARPAPAQEPRTAADESQRSPIEEKRETVSQAVDNSTPTPRNPGFLMKTQNLGVTYSQYLKEEIIDVEKSNDFSELTRQFRKRGAFEGTDEELARMALTAGLTVEQALNAFDRLKASLGRYKQREEEELIGMTVARFQKNGFRRPKTNKSLRTSATAAAFRAQLDTNERGREGAHAIERGVKRTLPTNGNPPSPTPLEREWASAQRELELMLPRAVFDQHLRNGRLVELAEESCTIEVRSAASVAVLEHRLKHRIAGVLSYQLQRPIDPTFVSRAD